MEAKDILTILRTPRVRILGNDLAVFDTLGTAMIAAVVAQKYDLNIPLTVGAAFLLGHATHKLLGVETALVGQDERTRSWPEGRRERREV